MRLLIEASNIRAGGGVTHLAALLDAAQPQAYGFTEVTVCAPSTTLCALPERSWLTKAHAPALNRGLAARFYWQHTQLPRLLKSCDVLFVPGGIYLGDFHPYIAMAQNLLPFASHERRRYGWSWTHFRLWLVGELQRRTFANADCVIHLTQGAREIVEAAFGNVIPPGQVIPHGVDSGFFAPPRPQAPLSTYSEARPFRFLYVSIINVYKHQWRVAEAVAQLRTEGLPVILDLVGPAYAPALQRLQTTFSRIPDARRIIRYLGPAAHHEVAQMCRHADTFVFASSCEALPIILLEAMAAGLPIACANRAPLPEVLGEAGVYFDPEDMNGIAAALRALLMDEHRREAVACAAHTRAHAYTWERCAHDTLTLLSAMVN